MTNEIDHKSRGHLTYGGSSAKYWLNCTGWGALRKQILPEILAQGNSEAADEGTAAHELAEAATRNLVDHYTSGNPLIEVWAQDYEMNEHVLAYRDWIWKEVLNESIVGKHCFFEQMVTLIPGLVGGPVDFFVIYIDRKGNRVGHIVDFKYGMIPVSSDADQLKVYGACLNHMLKEREKPLDLVKCSVFQPRVSLDPKTVTYTAKTIAKFTDKIHKQVAISESGKGKCKIGDHCTYCVNQGVGCHELTKAVKKNSSLNIVSSDVSIPIEDLDLEKVVELYKYSKEIEKMLRNVSRFLHSKAILLGEDIPGLKVVETKARRTWLDPEDTDTQSAVVKLAGTTDVLKNTLRGIGEVTKLVPKENRDSLDQYIGYTTTSKVLVPKDDEREEADKLVSKSLGELAELL